jgi:hypothetical protein
MRLVERLLWPRRGSKKSISLLILNGILVWFFALFPLLFPSQDIPEAQRKTRLLEAGFLGLQSACLP